MTPQSCPSAYEFRQLPEWGNPRIWANGVLTAESSDHADGNGRPLNLEMTVEQQGREETKGKQCPGRPKWSLPKSPLLRVLRLRSDSFIRGICAIRGQTPLPHPVPVICGYSGSPLRAKMAAASARLAACSLTRIDPTCFRTVSSPVFWRRAISRLLNPERSTEGLRTPAPTGGPGPQRPHQVRADGDLYTSRHRARERPATGQRLPDGLREG